MLHKALIVLLVCIMDYGCDCTLHVFLTLLLLLFLGVLISIYTMSVTHGNQPTHLINGCIGHLCCIKVPCFCSHTCKAGPQDRVLAVK